MATFRISPDKSQVWIEAKSSLHPIHGEARGMAGSIRAELADGRLDLSSPVEIRIELPVERLASGKALEDAEMMRRIDSRRYPTIRGQVNTIKEVNGRYRMVGDLTFHGVTREVDGEVTMSADNGSLVFEGEHTFDIREFGVQPPKILMLKVHPDVKVRVRVVAEPES